MATPATTKRKPVFVKVDQLKPGTNGHTLTVKVVSSKPVKTVSTRGGRPTVLAARPSRIAECLVGDETGTIIFTARNEQGTMMFLFVSTLLNVALFCDVCFFFFNLFEFHFNIIYQFLI